MKQYTFITQKKFNDIMDHFPAVYTDRLKLELMIAMTCLLL